MRLLAIDPGNVETGWVVIDENYKLLQFGKTPNEDLLFWLKRTPFDRVVIEMVASYGMPVGKTVFDTCVWIGRFTQAIYEYHKVEIVYVPRKEYVTELCGSSRAKDSNTIQYLIDRFAPDTPNRGKGTKKSPGYFYNVRKDVWQAIALGVYEMDRINGNDKT